MINLKNINVILTGATGGIGSAILDKLYSTNAKILATGTNQSKLDNINKKYENVITKKFDISNHALIEEFINECNDQLENKIDVLINNAGITSDNLTIRMKDEDWNKVLNLNLTSTFMVTKFAINCRCLCFIIF